MDKPFQRQGFLFRDDIRCARCKVGGQGRRTLFYFLNKEWVCGLCESETGVENEVKVEVEEKQGLRIEVNDEEREEAEEKQGLRIEVNDEEREEAEEKQGLRRELDPRAFGLFEGKKTEILFEGKFHKCEIEKIAETRVRVGYGNGEIEYVLNEDLEKRFKRRGGSGRNTVKGKKSKKKKGKKKGETEERLETWLSKNGFNEMIDIVKKHEIDKKILYILENEDLKVLGKLESEEVAEKIKVVRNIWRREKGK
eukprot:g4802.t1